MLSATAGSSTCLAGLIPNTPICDSPAAREALSVCEAYRKALDARDADKLLALASSDYFDDSGNSDASDDVDRADLEAHLRTTLAGVEAIRYGIRYKNVDFGAPASEGAAAGKPITVDYEYAASYRIKSEWHGKVDTSRLTLVHEGGTLRIRSGM